MSFLKGLFMKNGFFWFLTSLGIAALPSLALADIPQDKLIKVTKDANVKCVEYYHYKGELYCSTEAISKQPADAEIVKYEKFNVQFDNRKWQLAWGKKTDSLTTVEYVPSGDDINHWHELVTSQFFPSLQEKVTPKEFADVMINHLKEAGYTPIITFIKDTPDQVIYEFRIESPENQIQDELQMINKGKDGIYVLHYVIKKKDMGKNNRDLWVNNLSQSSMIEN